MPHVLVCAVTVPETPESGSQGVRETRVAAQTTNPGVSGSNAGKRLRLRISPIVCMQARIPGVRSDIRGPCGPQACTGACPHGADCRRIQKHLDLRRNLPFCADTRATRGLMVQVRTCRVRPVMRPDPGNNPHDPCRAAGFRDRSRKSSGRFPPHRGIPHTHLPHLVVRGFCMLYDASCVSPLHEKTPVRLICRVSFHCGSSYRRQHLAVLVLTFGGNPYTFICMWPRVSCADIAGSLEVLGQMAAFSAGGDHRAFRIHAHVESGGVSYIPR